MISIELKDDLNKKHQLTSSLERILKSVTEIMQATRAYQIVFRLFLVVEFLQILYFSIGSHLKNMWDMTIFSYLVTLTSYLNFEQMAVNSSSQGFDSLLGVCLALNGGIIICLILLPTAFVSKDKQISAIGSLLSKMVALYMMVFTTILVIPLSQLSFIGMRCNRSSQYYQSINMIIQTSTALTRL